MVMRRIFLDHSFWGRSADSTRRRTLQLVQAGLGGSQEVAAVEPERQASDSDSEFDDIDDPETFEEDADVDGPPTFADDD